MPRLGMEPIRRDALVKATIAEVGAARSTEVSVGRIARRAGMSSALAHHYFGGKEQILDAAMRHILRAYGAEVRRALKGATGPRARLNAVIAASFAPSNFEGDVASAWLTLYVRAQTAGTPRRLLRVYQRRLHSNLMAELRRLAPARAEALAATLAALIDGVYLRAALAEAPADAAAAEALASAALNRLLGERA